MTSISTFKSNLAGGGARPNQFRVILTFPSWVPSGPIATLKAGFLCEAASLPASTIGVASVPFRGINVPFAGDRQYQPWNLTVMNDVDFAIRNALEIWQQGIVENDTNLGRTVSSQYTATGLVQQLDRNDNIIKTYEFVDMFPENISDIPLAFGTNDTIETFGVTFRYTTWSSNLASTASAIGAVAGNTILSNIPTTGF